MPYDYAQTRLDGLRRLVEIANYRYTNRPDAYLCEEAEEALRRNVVRDIDFLLRLLDEAQADRQRLIDGISNFYDDSIQDAAIAYLLESVGVNDERCSDHNPRQHRDGRPPWCRNCGLTKDFKKPKGIFDK